VIKILIVRVLKHRNHISAGPLHYFRQTIIKKTFRSLLWCIICTFSKCIIWGRVIPTLI